MKNSVLIIEDDASLCAVSEFMLKAAGYRVTTCASGADGLRHFARQKPHVVITDVQMPGMSGYQVLTRLKETDPNAIVIVMTAYGSIENAVEAMKLGAFDYLAKPFSREQLLGIVGKAFKYDGMKQGQHLTPRAKGSAENPLVGESAAMQNLNRVIERIGASEATVLIQGESGTGKEVVARAIHNASIRTTGPFVPVNCAAIPRELLESELFGHIKGSFTGAISDRQGKFEQANGGTIFLDEIGDMPLELQPKLLRVLQEREIEVVGGKSKPIDVRVVAASNLDLEQAVAKDRFRQDLYYRLAVVPLSIPPLRERRDDVPMLARHFLAKHCNGQESRISEGAMAALTHYNWPGNVRELENIIEQMLVLCPTCTIAEQDLPPKIRFNTALQSKGVLNLPVEGFSLEQLEKEAMLQALTMNQWNVSKAAEFLRVPRHILAYRMDKYAIHAPTD